MIEDRLREALTFDDVLLLPAYAGLYFDEAGNGRRVDAALLEEKLAQATRYNA